jgi:hypothetical protein
MPVKKPSGLGLFRGLLLVWTLLNGLLGGIFLLFSMAFGSSGFGGQTSTGFGDNTMTASEVESAQASTLAMGLAMGLVVLLAVAAAPGPRPLRSAFA